MQHPDEGTMHAWVDGALSADELRELELHVATCAECAAALAHARGLQAAAARILSALDNVPAGIIPVMAADEQPRISSIEGARAGRRPLSAARWSIAAAVLLVAGGSWLVARDGGVEGVKSRGQVAVEMGMPAMATDTLAARGSAVRTAGDASETQRSVASASERTAGTTGVRPGGAVARRAAAPKEMMESRVEQAVAPPPAVVSQGSRQAAAASTAEGFTGSAGAVASGSANTMASDVSAPPAPRMRMRGSTSSAAPRADAAVVAGRAGFDSALALDSVLTSRLTLAPQASAERARAMAATSAAGAPGTGSTVEARAAGCYAFVAPSWRGQLSQADDARSLLSRRLELRRELGTFADEAGELLVRPAPGEAPFRSGTAGFWSVLGDEQIRITIGDPDSWITLTLAMAPSALRGRARFYSAVDEEQHIADVVGTRRDCGVVR